MPSIITNAAVESCLREILTREGFTLNQTRALGENGVDIVATCADETVFVEVIGFKSSGPARSRDFYEAFFRVVSRLRDGAKKLAIALPTRAATGLPARAGQYGEAWLRIGRAFPELEIWLVDLNAGAYKRTPWNSWLDYATADAVPPLPTPLRSA